MEESPPEKDLRDVQRSIGVAIRVRPLNTRERNSDSFTGRPIKNPVVVRCQDNMIVLLDPYALPDASERALRERVFAFEYVFDPSVGNEEVFERSVKNLLDGVLDGYNATCFAFGNTGAGKTHTMFGDLENRSGSGGGSGGSGICTLAAEDLFQRMEAMPDFDFRIKMSYLEIYNEKIKDLLTPQPSSPTTTTHDSNKKIITNTHIHSQFSRDISQQQQQVAVQPFLDVQEDPVRGVMVAGLLEIEVKDIGQVQELIMMGNTRRTMAPTGANIVSSRSHAVLQFCIEKKERAQGLIDRVTLGKLSLVDLAGSERAASSDNRGMRMVEGANINRSLLALGNCINVLSQHNQNRTRSSSLENGQDPSQQDSKPKFVPYRDSKLTRLLKDSLGGNTRTLMIANISPSALLYEETLNTLKYASRASKIKRSVTRNTMAVQHHISEYKEIIESLRSEVESLRQELVSSKRSSHSAPVSPTFHHMRPEKLSLSDFATSSTLGSAVGREEVDEIEIGFDSSSNLGSSKMLKGPPAADMISQELSINSQERELLNSDLAKINDLWEESIFYLNEENRTNFEERNQHKMALFGILLDTIRPLLFGKNSEKGVPTTNKKSEIFEKLNTNSGKSDEWFLLSVLESLAKLKLERAIAVGKHLEIQKRDAKLVKDLELRSQQISELLKENAHLRSQLENFSTNQKPKTPTISKSGGISRQSAAPPLFSPALVGGRVVSDTPRGASIYPSILESASCSFQHTADPLFKKALPTQLEPNKPGGKVLSASVRNKIITNPTPTSKNQKRMSSPTARPNSQPASTTRAPSKEKLSGSGNSQITQTLNRTNSIGRNLGTASVVQRNGRSMALSPPSRQAAAPKTKPPTSFQYPVPPKPSATTTTNTPLPSLSPPPKRTKSETSLLASMRSHPPLSSLVSPSLGSQKTQGPQNLLSVPSQQQQRRSASVEHREPNVRFQDLEKIPDSHISTLVDHVLSRSADARNGMAAPMTPGELDKLVPGNDLDSQRLKRRLSRIASAPDGGIGLSNSRPATPPPLSADPIFTTLGDFKSRQDAPLSQQAENVGGQADDEGKDLRILELERIRVELQKSKMERENRLRSTSPGAKSQDTPSPFPLNSLTSSSTPSSLPIQQTPHRTSAPLLNALHTPGESDLVGSASAVSTAPSPTTVALFSSVQSTLARLSKLTGASGLSFPNDSPSRDPLDSTLSHSTSPMCQTVSAAHSVLGNVLSSEKLEQKPVPVGTTSSLRPSASEILHQMYPQLFSTTISASSPSPQTQALSSPIFASPDASKSPQVIPRPPTREAPKLNLEKLKQTQDIAGTKAF